MIINPKVAVKEKWIYPVSKKQMQPNSIDLRLESVSMMKQGIYTSSLSRLDYSRPYPTYKKDQWKNVGYSKGNIYNKKSNTFGLLAGRAYQFTMKESVKIPKDVCGFVCHRSSFNRYGVLMISSLYDSGYENYVGCTCYPHITCRIEKGSRVACIVFMKSEASHLYSGQYQHRRK